MATASAGAALPRSAVVDLGSNSVRLVVFEGTGRVPAIIFNEKAVLRLGRGLQTTGRLNDAALDDAEAVMRRYRAVARAMRADPFEVLATAAIRDASNGAAFADRLQGSLPGVPIRILSGEQEAAYSAAGLVCGRPAATGILADVGGGSLELVRLHRGRPGQGRTLRLGLIRLSERAGQDLSSGRAIVESDLAAVDWIGGAAGLDLFLVGGAWRALARIHMAMTAYPIAIIDQYTLEREAARAFAGEMVAMPRRTLERLPGAPRRRLDDIPWAGLLLRRLLRATGAARIVFSVSGLREGWYLDRVADDADGDDPLLSACRDFAGSLGRASGMPEALLGWTAPLFVDESPEEARLRRAVCLLSDIGSRDHPEYRAEQAFFRVVRQPGPGIEHAARAFLGYAVALRYEAEPGAAFLAGIDSLMGPFARRTAQILGRALRLAYTLSAGTPDLLAATRLSVSDRLVLHVTAGSGVFAGEGVLRRLERLGEATGLPAQAIEDEVP
jgi:exopolyphosphatase/guanosine-5'-triphosphate,3'-diphosphate pyrophosphatase